MTDANYDGDLDPGSTGPQVVKLSSSIEIGDNLVVDSIKLLEPKAKHLRDLPLDASRMTFAHLFELAKRLAVVELDGGKTMALPGKYIDDLTPADTSKVTRAVAGFVARFQ